MLPDNPHAAYIRALVDKAPPLTPEKRRRLASILGVSAVSAEPQPALQQEAV